MALTNKASSSRSSAPNDDNVMNDLVQRSGDVRIDDGRVEVPGQVPPSGLQAPVVYRVPGMFNVRVP